MNEVDQWAGVPFQSVYEDYAEVPTYRCPCCRSLTLHGRGHFEMCPVCRWEDDGQDEAEAARVRGGPNGMLSLTQARLNFARCGACDPERAVRARPPTEAER